jgi:hypothetical protein
MHPSAGEMPLPEQLTDLQYLSYSTHFGTYGTQCWFAGFWCHTSTIKSFVFFSLIWLVYLTHFLFKHCIGELRYPAVRCTSVGLSDNPFPHFSARSLLQSCDCRMLCGLPKMASNFAFTHLVPWIKCSFTCCKCTTWDTQPYFPHKIGCATDLYCP